MDAMTTVLVAVSLAGVDPDLARQHFAEARALSDRDGGALWGVPLYGPMILVDRSTREAVANVPDDEGVLRPESGVYVGRLPDALGIANTSVEWAGTRFTMIIWPLPEDRVDRRRLMMHESFHRIQPQLSMTTREAGNAHLDKAEGRLWMRLEWRALAAALASEGDDRRRAVADALLFRACRRAIFPDAALQETLLESNEGLAEYTGLRLCGAEPHVQLDRAVIALGEADARDSFVRSFAYASGPAWALLLDEADPEWRGGMSVDQALDDVLRDAGGYTAPDDVQARAAGRATAYGFDQVRAQEEQRRRAAEAQLAAARARYVDGPLLIVPLAGPQFEFDPGRVRPLEGHGTIYEVLELRDQWGSMKAGTGALLTEGFALHLPKPGKPHGSTIAGDGWTLTLADGWALAPGSRSGDWRVTPAGDPAPAAPRP